MGSMIDTPKTVKEYKKWVAAAGGRARKEALTPARRTQIARDAGLANAERLRKLKLAKQDGTHDATLIGS